jgi:hypothetical protein
LAPTGAKLSRPPRRLEVRMNLPNLPNLSFHSGALVGVVVGAVLATLSGILGNQYEAFALRRERERTAALLFGEVFSTMRILLEGARASVETGEPFGPLTRRLLVATRREVEIYERNRESLVALHEAQLRSDMHNVALRIAMPLDGLMESFLAPEGDARDAERRRVFAFLMENASRIPNLTERLGRIAKHNFEDYGEAVRLRPAEPSDA